jgi:branched-chain amino acid transport system ATP-binding protein
MTALLRVENLVKTYGGVVAVDGVTFEIAEGRITGLIGPNGAGKSTLFDMIAGAVRSDAGRIVFRGEDVAGLKTHQMFHRGIVRTFQIPHEFGRLTVLENLMVVPSGQPGESITGPFVAPAAVAAREAEVRAQAHEVLEFLTLDHLAGELAETLSGGQKKLLELGRTMMAEPALVLLDEPGAGVNPTLLGKLADMIRRLNRERGYTFCIIEHDMDLIASLCDPVIVLAEGQVLTEGTMKEVRADARVLDAYLGGAEAA